VGCARSSARGGWESLLRGGGAEREWRWGRSREGSLGLRPDAVAARRYLKVRLDLRDVDRVDKRRSFSAKDRRLAVGDHRDKYNVRTGDRTRPELVGRVVSDPVRALEPCVVGAAALELQRARTGQREPRDGGDELVVCGSSLTGARESEAESHP
jgi:hypothetical protein